MNGKELVIAIKERIGCRSNTLKMIPPIGMSIDEAKNWSRLTACQYCPATDLCKPGIKKVKDEVWITPNFDPMTLARKLKLIE